MQDASRDTEVLVDALKFYVASWVSVILSFHGYLTDQILLNWRDITFS